MNNVAISKIEVTINKKTLELTLEEAKELKEILNEVFEKAMPVVPVVEPVPQPIYIPNPQPYRWYQWEITCTDPNSTTGTLCLARNQDNN